MSNSGHSGAGNMCHRSVHHSKKARNNHGVSRSLVYRNGPQDALSPVRRLRKAHGQLLRRHLLAEGHASMPITSLQNLRDGHKASLPRSATHAKSESHWAVSAGGVSTVPPHRHRRIPRRLAMNQNKERTTDGNEPEGLEAEVPQTANSIGLARAQ